MHIATNPTTWDTEGPGLCHGTADLLTDAPRARRLAQSAAHATVTETAATPGFLDGNAGVALSLADAADLLAHPPAMSSASLMPRS